MKFKAAIFDLDGVIVDTAKYHYLAWKRLAASYGFDFTESDNERLKGVSRMASLEILLSIGNITLSEEEKISAAEKKNMWYLEYITKMTADEILPGALDYLKALKDNNILISLGSASKNAPLIIKRLGLEEYFDAIVDGYSVQKVKPDPEVFLVAAQKLNMKAEDCVVFEDAPAGIEAAIAANMQCVGIGDNGILSKADIVIPGLYAAEERVGIGQ